MIWSPAADLQATKLNHFMTTILHLTDLHLLSDADARLKGVPTRETLRDVLQHARESGREFDAVVVTGDCSHDEQRPSYEAMRELLGDLIDRCLFVPGNHDDRTLLRDVFEDRIDDEGAEWITFSQSIAGWRLIGLDSHWPGQVEGRIEPAQLDWLRDELHRVSPQPCGLFLHHPIVPVGCEWLDRIGLVEPEPLLQIIAANPHVGFVCAGHVHHASEVICGETAYYTTPSTGIQFLPVGTEAAFAAIPPGYRVIELEGDRFTTAVHQLAELRHPPTVGPG